MLSVRDEQAAAPAETMPVKAVEPSGEEVEIAEVVDTVAAPAALPTTVSPLPVLALLGLLAVGAGLAVRLHLATDVA